jgi:hypothetical protein
VLAHYVLNALVGYGGAIATADATYSSYAHRDAVLVFQFYGSAQSGSSFPADGLDVINGMVTSLAPNPTAACAFFLSPATAMVT